MRSRAIARTRSRVCCSSSLSQKASAATAGALRVVRVEALAGFASELSGHHHPLEQRRRRVARLAELLEHYFRHVHGRVEADEVEQRERSHGIAAAELHRLVDVLEGSETAFAGAKGVEQVGHQQPVDA